jgi:hypothetical protein
VKSPIENKGVGSLRQRKTWECADCRNIQKPSTALPNGYELTQNVMLFPVRFGLLFRTPRLKKLAQSTDHQPKKAEQPDWVELIGSTVTRISEFSYGTIARPIRP